jgi:phosphohistidine phosphatase
MKTLLLLRHAKSSWDDPELDDHDRPLNKRGKRDAPRIGQLLVQQNLAPDCIVTSTAKRARKTAKLVAEAANYDGQTIETSELYHAAPQSFIEVLRLLPSHIARPLLIGHNPGMEEFLCRLTGSDEIMATATLAQVELPVAAWDELSLNCAARLANIWRPRELEGTGGL